MIEEVIKLFVCCDCGRIFEQPMNYRERHGLDTLPYEEFSGSPCCAGAYTEAHRCDCCSEWITGSYVKTNDGERFCENCIISYELGEEEG